MTRLPPISTLFPYTTLFRSLRHVDETSVSQRRCRDDGFRVRARRVSRTRRTAPGRARRVRETDRKSTRLNSSHRCISYAVFCLKKKKNNKTQQTTTQSRKQL